MKIVGFLLRSMTLLVVVYISSTKHDLLPTEWSFGLIRQLLSTIKLCMHATIFSFRGSLLSWSLL